MNNTFYPFHVLFNCDTRAILVHELMNGGGINKAGGSVAQWVERATPGEEVPCSIPAVAARSLLVESVSV